MNFKNLVSKIYNDKKLLLLSVFLFSIFVSFVFLLLLGNLGPSEHAIPGSDYFNSYEPVANSIFQGKGIPVEEDFAVRYPPGYPVILSAIFGLSLLLGLGKLGLIVFFNVIVAALSTCFLFLFVKTIFKKKIALIASLLWLSYPFNLWFLKNPNTEVPFILFLFLSFWLFAKGTKKNSLKLFLLSGVFVGVASLIRPITVFLFIPMVVMIFFLLKEISFSRKILISLLLTIAYLAVIAPWIIYVFSKTGEIIPLSTGGATSMAAGITMMAGNAREDSLIILQDDVLALIDRAKEIDRSSSLNVFRFFAEEMTNHPVAFLKLMVIKATRAWYGTSEMWWELQILLVQLFYLIPGFAGIIIAFKKIKGKKAYLAFLLLLIFYFWAATIAALSIFRYMVPVMAIIFIFWAVFFKELTSNFIRFFQDET